MREVIATNRACPISRETRDQHVVRIVAAIVVLVVAGAVVVRGPLAAVVLFVLGADFAVRAFGQPRHSPLAAVARGMVHALKMRPQPVDAAPKRFAAKIGLVFSLSASVLFLAQVPVGAIAVAAILGFCALLESAFGVCIGCKVYAALPRPR